MSGPAWETERWTGEPDREMDRLEESSSVQKETLHLSLLIIDFGLCSEFGQTESPISLGVGEHMTLHL